MIFGGRGERGKHRGIIQRSSGILRVEVMETHCGEVQPPHLGRLTEADGRKRYENT